MKPSEKTIFRFGQDHEPDLICLSWPEPVQVVYEKQNEQHEKEENECDDQT